MSYNLVCNRILYIDPHFDFNHLRFNINTDGIIECVYYFNDTSRIPDYLHEVTPSDLISYIEMCLEEEEIFNVFPAQLFYYVHFLSIDDVNSRACLGDSSALAFLARHFPHEAAPVCIELPALF